MDNKSATWLTLIIMSLAAFITTFDTTFMNVAIINLVQDLNTTVGTVQVIITIYSLTIGCLLIVGAKIQDIIGRRRTFVIGSLLYGVGALIATFSFNDVMLLIGWSFLEGIGAALMMPASFSIIAGTYEGERRTLAIGLVGGISSIAAAIGPLLGGFLTSFLSWRVGFGIEVLIVIVMVIAAPKIIEFPITISWKDLDILGSILSALGIFLVVLGILQLNNVNDWYLFPYLTITGIILLLTFFWWQKKRISQNKSPLLDIKLLKIKTFSVGNLVKLIANIGMAGVIFIIPVFMGTVVDSNAFMIGLSLLPLTMSMLVFSLIAHRLAHYIKPTYLVSLGLIIAILGCLMLRNTFTLETTLLDLVPGTAFIGAGCGLSFILAVDMIVNSAGDKQSDASGLVNTVSMFGWAIGTALIGVVLLVGTFAGLTAAVEHQYPGQYTKQEIQTNLHDWIQKYESVDLKGFKNDKSKVAMIADETIANAMNTAFDATAVIFLLGLVGSFFLWREPKKIISI